MQNQVVEPLKRFEIDSAKDGISRKWRFGEDSAGDSSFFGPVYASVTFLVMLQVHPHNLQHTQIDGFGSNPSTGKSMQFALNVCHCNISVCKMLIFW